MVARASRFLHRYRIGGAHCRHEVEASLVGMVAQVARAVRTAVAVAARVVVPMEAGAEEAPAAVLTEAAEEGEEAPVAPVEAAGVPLAVAAAITSSNAPEEDHGLGLRLLCVGADQAQNAAYFFMALASLPFWCRIM
jgi:hypothetical protein